MSPFDVADPSAPTLILHRATDAELFRILAATATTRTPPLHLATWDEVARILGNAPTNVPVGIDTTAS